MMRLLALILLLAAAGTAAHAQENILWRVINAQPATIVPAYSGQPSPFPGAAAAPSTTTAEITAEQEQQRRERAEALQKAEQLLASRLAVTPEMRAISVGGRIEGMAGPKVLINNQWVGVNTEVWVQVTKSQQALDAIQILRDYDSEAADELDRRLTQSINKNPRIRMKLQKILSNTLVFSTPQGSQRVPINLQGANAY